SKEYDYEATEVTVTGIDFASGDSSQGIPGIHNSYYLDDDGTMVTIWRDRMSIDDINQLSLMRIGKDGGVVNKKTIFLNPHVRPDEGAWTTMNISVPDSIFKNARGNTVLFTHYMRYQDDDAEYKGYIYAFEEYDADFNLVKSVEHGANLPDDNLQYYISMDDNGYFYTAVSSGVFVYNADFEFIGAIEDMPVPEEREYFMPATGSDGACYAYFFTKEDRDIYKLDPVTLTSEYAFTLPLSRSAWLWRGDESDGALFYALGALTGRREKEASGLLLRIDLSGEASKVMDWEEQGIAPYFHGIGYTSEEDYEENWKGKPAAQYSENGNFYNLVVEDADGSNDTLDDRVLKLYSFYRVPKLD
ncbi:MAG: hypothetical protein LBM59_03460, partial [Ruminococcus sp.]|nr:hypothetical protein [Ruminococcus sp.]